MIYLTPRLIQSGCDSRSVFNVIKLPKLAKACLSWPNLVLADQNLCKLLIAGHTTATERMLRNGEWNAWEERWPSARNRYYFCSIHLDGRNTLLFLCQSIRQNPRWGKAPTDFLSVTQGRKFGSPSNNRTSFQP